MIKALNSYTVCVCRQGSKKLQFATALTVATNKKAAVDRVIRLYAGDDPLLLERDLVAVDAYSDTSLQLLQADGWNDVDEALAAFMRIEGGILLRSRPERTKIRTTPRETVASVKKGTASRSKTDVAATVEKMNRAPLRATAAGYAAEVFERVNKGSRPAAIPVAAKRKAAVAKRVAAPKPKPKATAKPEKKQKRS
jgi:hypothetical protein